MPVIVASCGEDEEDETREVGLQVSVLSPCLDECDESRY
jgi:hypothetical protein